MESTKQIQSLFFFLFSFFEMQDQKIKFWFADRKKVSKPRSANRAATKGQFYKPHQLISITKRFSPDCKTAIFWNTFQITKHTLSRLHTLPSCKPVPCLAHLQGALRSRQPCACFLTCMHEPGTFPPNTQGNPVHCSSANV